MAVLCYKPCRNRNRIQNVPTDPTSRRQTRRASRTSNTPREPYRFGPRKSTCENTKKKYKPSASETIILFFTFHSERLTIDSIVPVILLTCTPFRGTMEVDKEGPVVKMGSEYALRFEDNTNLEEVYTERAKNELGETPERRAEALEELRRLIRGTC